MKKLLLLSTLLCLAWLSNGQSSFSTLPEKITSRKAFKRAEWFELQRRLPYDTFPEHRYVKEMMQEITKAKANRSGGDAYPYWYSVGPKGITTNYNNTGIVSGRVRAVAVHPTDPQTLYIGAASGGIWKTTDGGQNWQDIGHDLPSLAFGAIAIDPNNPETVYAGSGESTLLSDWFAPVGCGLFKSTDGGQSWTVITDGFGNLTHFSDIIVNPNNSDIVFASLCHGSNYLGMAFPNEGVWKSTDGGVTWNRCLEVACPFDLAFHPFNPDTVYAGIGGLFSPLGGFYKSTDGGETWTQSSDGLGSYPLGGRMQFDISQSNPEIIYAVIYEFTWDFGVNTKAFKSVNGGQSWSQISADTPLGGFYNGWYDQGWYDLCIAVDPVSPDHVLIGNAELHRTTNGSNFVPVRPWGNDANGTLVHVDYHKLVYAPSDPNILYIGCDGGIYKSPDKGYTASSLNAGLETLQFYRITSHPDDPGVIFGGMQDNGSARTTDGGNTWYQKIGADGMECFYDYSNPLKLFNSIQYGDLYRSNNGGNSWQYVESLQGAWTTPVFMHPEIPDIIYAGTRHIKKSTDGGYNFTVIAPNVSVQNISTMAQSQVDPDYMIFGTGQDHPVDSLFLVKISTDEGVTWTDVTENIPGEPRWISRVLTDPADVNTMYVLRTGFSPGNKVYKTTNLGQTWTNISGDLPDLPCSDLFIDPDNPGHLYLATDIGVYMSVNGGESWTYASEGMPWVACLDFSYVKIDDVPYLRVGTYGRSIYETRLDIGVGVDQLAVGSQQLAVSCYPNPTGGIVDFQWTTDNGQWTILKIYSAQGQEIEVLTEKTSKTGHHQLQWNAKDAPAGIYYYRLIDSDKTTIASGKIIKQ